MKKMKKYFKYICLCSLAIGLYSCDEDDDLSFEAAGANTVLVDNEISVFDQNEDLTIRLLPYDSEFQSVEIAKSGGNVITEATILDDSTATFNTSTLGELTAGENFDISIVSTLSNGQVLSQPFSIAVTDAITLANNPGMVRYLDTTATALSFNTSTFSAPVDNVSLFRRTNLDTTFMDIGETFEVEGDEIDLGDIDYEELGVSVGDTIFYRFEAQSGELKQSVDTQVVIETQEFGSPNATTVSNNPSMSGYNLSDADYSAAGETGEIMFQDPMGFTTMDGIDFVQPVIPEDMTGMEYTSGLDLFEAEMEYEAGIKITSVDEVEMGDVFIYKTSRNGMQVYGIILIGDVSTTSINGEETKSFDLEFMEGSIIRE
jgi:hypothetical protein